MVLHKQHAFRPTSERTHFLSKAGQHFNVADGNLKKKKKRVILRKCWCHEDVHCRLIHSMDGEYFLKKNIRRKNEKGKHPCQLMVMVELTKKGTVQSRWTKLTEREWRRPLTWLDRFRDAVLLPASWGDEHIQPYVGNKCLKELFCKSQHILASEALKAQATAG